jgi:hypothetical protein
MVHGAWCMGHNAVNSAVITSAEVSLITAVSSNSSLMAEEEAKGAGHEGDGGFNRSMILTEVGEPSVMPLSRGAEVGS